MCKPYRATWATSTLQTDIYIIYSYTETSHREQVLISYYNAFDFYISRLLRT